MKQGLKLKLKIELQLIVCASKLQSSRYFQLPGKVWCVNSVQWFQLTGLSKCSLVLVCELISLKKMNFSKNFTLDLMLQIKMIEPTLRIAVIELIRLSKEILDWFWKPFPISDVLWKRFYSESISAESFFFSVSFYTEFRCLVKHFNQTFYEVLRNVSFDK